MFLTSTIFYIVRHNKHFSGNLAGGKYTLGKGIKIFILSTLTFASLIHTIDAVLAFLSVNQAQLLRIYPLIGEYLAQMPLNIYLWTSAGSTIAFWAITCIVAFNNPIEAFINKTLSDCQEQKETGQHVLEAHSDFFDSMYQTMEESKRELGQTHDLVWNLRGEIKDMQKMKGTFEETRKELVDLKKQVRMMEEKIIFPLRCKACGKPSRADFSLCPYCGSEIKIREEAVCKPVFSVESPRTK
jgi:predicted Zn-ribbon and HTH transcriptional regulator